MQIIKLVLFFFFIKLPIPSEKKVLYGIMTNNHVIDSNFIENNEYFKIYLNQLPEKLEEDSKNSYNISLDKNNFIFTSELIDVTFISELIDVTFISELIDVTFISELIDVTFIELSARDVQNSDFTFFGLDNDFIEGN